MLSFRFQGLTAGTVARVYIATDSLPDPVKDQWILDST